VVNRFVRSAIAFMIIGASMSIAGASMSIAVRVSAQSKALAPPPPKNPPPQFYIDPRNPPKEDPNFKPPLTKEGVPDISGTWVQESDIITYSIEDPEAERAEHVALGGQRPMIGRPIIDPPDGKIPYLPWAAKLAEQLNLEHKHPSKPEYLDPVSRGYQEGLPRINYQGQFTVRQFPGTVLINYDYHHSYRVIPTDGSPHVPQQIKLWMGDSRARWEGNTLVVDVTSITDQTWFDIVGAFHSDQMHLVERWTYASLNHIVYIATIDDPSVFTQPWKLRVDMRRIPGDEQWENAVWEGNKLGGLSEDFWGALKKP
jgi:hypothetical protein